MQTLLLWMQLKITERQLDAAQAEQADKLSQRITRLRSLVAKFEAWDVAPSAKYNKIDCTQPCRLTALAEAVTEAHQFNQHLGGRLMALAHLSLTEPNPDQSRLPALPKQSMAAESLLAYVEILSKYSQTIVRLVSQPVRATTLRNALPSLAVSLDSAALDCLAEDAAIVGIRADAERLSKFLDAAGADAIDRPNPYDYRAKWVPESPKIYERTEAIAPPALPTVGQYIDEANMLVGRLALNGKGVHASCLQALSRDFAALRSLESLTHL